MSTHGAGIILIVCLLGSGACIVALAVAEQLFVDRLNRRDRDGR